MPNHTHRKISFVLSAKQMEVFGTYATDEFVNKTILFLRKYFVEWAAGKDDIALQGYIRSMIVFGKKHHVQKQINLQKLMHYHIQYAFDIPLQAGLAKILGSAGENENNRVRYFRQALQQTATAANDNKNKI